MLCTTAQRNTPGALSSGKTILNLLAPQCPTPPCEAPSAAGVARFARTLTKRLAAPLDGPSALGARLALIAFGIGVVEVVYTARTALAAGQRVSLLVAVQRASDAVLLPELCEAAAAAAAAASAAAPGAATRPFKWRCYCRARLHRKSCSWSWTGFAAAGLARRAGAA